MDTIIQISGFLCLWIAVGIGRKEDSKIKFMSGNWWLALILIEVGTLIINR